MEYLSLTFNSNNYIESKNNVNFNNIIDKSSLIDYDNGIIIINKIGKYIVNYWISTLSTKENNVSFSLVDNDSNPVVPNQSFPGFVILNVEAVPYSFSLINITNNNVYFSNDLSAYIYLNLLEILSIKESINCFMNRQMINVLKQLIIKYPGEQTTVYLEGLSRGNGAISSVLEYNNNGFLVMEDDVNTIYMSVPYINSIYYQNTSFNNDLDYLPINNIKGCNLGLIEVYNDILNTDKLIRIGLDVVTTVDCYVVENVNGITVVTGDGGNDFMVINTLEIEYVNIPK